MGGVAQVRLKAGVYNPPALRAPRRVAAFKPPLPACRYRPAPANLSPRATARPPSCLPMHEPHLRGAIRVWLNRQSAGEALTFGWRNDARHFVWAPTVETTRSGVENECGFARVIRLEKQLANASKARASERVRMGCAMGGCDARKCAVRSEVVDEFR